MPNYLLRSGHRAPRLLVALAAIALSGCTTVGPEYTVRPVAAPVQWQATVPHAGSSPGLAEWWAQFNDPVLSGLIAEAESTGPTLAVAAARIAESRAALTGSTAKGAPAATGTGRMARAGSTSDGAAAPVSTGSVAIDASWEVDLFGRVQRGTEAARARLESRQFEWHAARVSVAAEVADGYVGYRSCQQLVAASARDVASREATAGLISMLVEAGFRAPVEGETVAAGLADAQAELANQRAQCDLAVKSLVVLVGIPEQTLRAQLGQGDSDVLPVPAAFEVTTLPVNVLAQRPDLAAAERGLAAATADVGVAEANRYPRLSLSGSLSISMLNGVSTVTSRPWSIGPSLTVPVFDAGQRRAEVAAAAARLAQQQANYAMSVRLAVAEVERAMVVLGSSQAQESRARAAVSGYARVLTSTEAHLRAGGASLLALEEARRNANSTERKLLVLQRERVRAWISLYKAVGGGWSASAGDNQ